MAVNILVGDCREKLKELPANYFHTCVSSPPYFGLRDYGVGAENGEIGLEPTPDEFVAALVAVFREVRRVLRDDGTVWLNLGDSYAGGGNGGGGGFAADRASWRSVPARSGQRAAVGGLKPKDLIGIPWRVAFALQADGWYLRQDIIWSKPNPMPESVRDRCTKAHEYLFLLSKSPRYYFDAKAIAERAVGLTEHDLTGPGYSVPGQPPHKGNRRAKGNARTFRGGGAYTQGRSFDNDAVIARESHGNQPNETGLRNRRSVWTVATQPYSGAHFATFPPDLVEPCILAGCPVGGHVLDPFGGSGTTGLVARNLNRAATLIELNPAYAALAKERVHGPLFAGAAE